MARLSLNPFPIHGSTKTDITYTTIGATDITTNTLSWRLTLIREWRGKGDH